MSGDIPMRARRGDLRDLGHDIIKKFPNKKVSFIETLEINKKHVVIPENFKKEYNYKISKNKLIKDKDLCLGSSDDRGLRIKLENDKIYFFKRICDHQGADLSCAKFDNNRLMCPWHGKKMPPICELDLNNISFTGENINISEASGNILIDYTVN